MSDDDLHLRAQHLARALDLLAHEPSTIPGADGAGAELGRLCRAASSYLSVSCAVVTVNGHDGADAVAATSGAEAHQYVEFQLTTGEGPCVDVRRTARPVLVPDLAQVDRGRWPGYLELAIDAGVGAVFALPLHVGAVQLGVLELYAARPSPVTDQQAATLLAFARIGTEILLSDDSPAERRLHDLLDSVDYRPEVYQAQGMLMVSLGVGLAEALVRMRAHAFTHRRSLSELAHEIIAGRTFEDDEI